MNYFHETVVFCRLPVAAQGTKIALSIKWQGDFNE
jgi:hypothetical protein